MGGSIPVLAEAVSSANEGCREEICIPVQVLHSSLSTTQQKTLNLQRNQINISFQASVD